FISMSTIGVPLAVSKFVAKYNSLDDYQTGMRMFKAGIALMAITGFLAFLILFFSAEKLRSEEHTSELQSRFDLVCRLRLDKKKDRSNAQHSARENVSGNACARGNWLNTTLALRAVVLVFNSRGVPDTGSGAAVLGQSETVR